MASRTLAETRPDRLPDGAPLDYAPENEQGVVFLFSHLARTFGFHVERVQTGFGELISKSEKDQILNCF